MAKKAINKSEVQTNYEKAHIIINTLKTIITDADNMQYALVKQFYNHYHKNNYDLAYQIINEGFNQCYIAGYKYLELCKLVNKKGEFYEIATKNPLVNL